MQVRAGHHHMATGKPLPWPDFGTHTTLGNLHSASLLLDLVYPRLCKSVIVSIYSTRRRTASGVVGIGSGTVESIGNTFGLVTTAVLAGMSR